jgi:hypothetical protein
MEGITKYLSVLTLNDNGFIFSIERHQLKHWIKKENPTDHFLQEIYLMTETNIALG